MEETAFSSKKEGRSYSKAGRVKHHYPHPEYKTRLFMLEIMRITRGGKSLSDHYITEFEKTILSYKIDNVGVEIEDIISLELYKEKQDVA